MPRVTFVQPDGSRQTVEASPGRTGMDVARAHRVQGLLGICGGAVQCSTCHCYVDAEWVGRLPPQLQREANLIEFVPEPRPASRLACQLVLTDALDGLVLHVPAEQL